MPEVSVLDFGEQAVASRFDQKIVGTCQERVCGAFRNCPCDRVTDLEIQRDAKVRIEMPLNIEVRTVGNRQIDLLRRNFRQQIGKLNVGVLFPGELRVRRLERSEQIDMAAACYDFDRSSENVFDLSRLAGTQFVNQVHVDGLVRMPEVQIFAPRFRNRQSGCRHMRVAGYKHGHNFGNAVDRIYNQRDAEIFGERPYEIVLRARRTPGPHRECSL